MSRWGKAEAAAAQRSEPGQSIVRYVRCLGCRASFPLTWTVASTHLDGTIDGVAFDGRLFAEHPCPGNPKREDAPGPAAMPRPKPMPEREWSARMRRLQEQKTDMHRKGEM